MIYFEEARGARDRRGTRASCPVLVNPGLGEQHWAMTPEALFTAALQLEAGWKVTECRFEDEPRRLLLKLDF
jgi:hypothetical protein